MTKFTPLLTSKFKKIYPISIKFGGFRYLVGTTIDTREELFQNIVRHKRNLKGSVAV